MSELDDLYVWSCSICGPSMDNSANWCDLGCGSDYNKMTKVFYDPDIKLKSEKD